MEPTIKTGDSVEITSGPYCVSHALWEFSVVAVDDSTGTAKLLPAAFGGFRSPLKVATKDLSRKTWAVAKSQQIGLRRRAIFPCRLRSRGIGVDGTARVLCHYAPQFGHVGDRRSLGKQLRVRPDQLPSHGVGTGFLLLPVIV